MHGERSVPYGGDVQPDQRGLLEPGGDQRDGVQRRERVHADRHLPERACALRRARCVAPPATSATSPEPATRRAALARTRWRPTGRRAATATRARRRDTCQAGTCTGANPVTCAATDACHAAGTCNPATGTCSNPAAANGTACNDGNACTQTDTCQSRDLHGSEPGDVHGERRSATWRGRAIRAPGPARTRPRRTAPRATTATPARRPTRARAGRARARTP